MSLSTLRNEIDVLNREIIKLLGKRTEIARQIARIKREEKLPILDPERESAIKEEIRDLAKQHHLSAPVIEEMFELLLAYTRLEMELV